MTSAFEKHDLPNGTSIFYRDSDHAYFSAVKPDGTGKGRLAGVSTVIAPLDFRPDSLMRWSARMNGEGVAILASDGLSLDDADDIRSALRWLQSGDSIWSALADSQLLYLDRKDDAARRGTNVHVQGLHALANGQPVPDRSLMTDEEWGYVRGVMAFWHEHEPEPLQAEQVVGDLELGVAGRFDLRARLHGKHGGEKLNARVCLVDAKTSGFIPCKHHGQLAGYDLLADRCGIGASDSLFILQVTPDGGYNLLDCQATREDFLAALTVYRSAGRINREARKARQAVAS